MAFTTWATLKTTILNALKDGSILTKSYTLNDRTMTFRDLGEVMDFLKFIDQQIASESGSGRTYAKFMNADD